MPHYTFYYNGGDESLKVEKIATIYVNENGVFGSVSIYAKIYDEITMEFDKPVVIRFVEETKDFFVSSEDALDDNEKALDEAIEYWKERIAKKKSLIEKLIEKGYKITVNKEDC